MFDFFNVTARSAAAALKLATLSGGNLEVDGTRVLTQVPEHWEAIEDPLGAGVFLRIEITTAKPLAEIPLGQIAGLQRFTSGARKSPFWIAPVAGSTCAQICPETMWILARLEQDRYLLVVPLLSDNTRYSLAGGADGLRVVAETGDAQVNAGGGVAVFVALGRDPYALTAAAARSVVRHQGAGRLRLEKQEPDFVDYLGWCTWDAFYQEVSTEKVLAGLSSFAAGGVKPRFMILDDGWQAVTKTPSGETRLAAFATNDRFPGGLASLITSTKTKYGIKRFLVWQTLIGYWGGAAEDTLPGYGTRTVARSYGPAIARLESNWNAQPWGAVAGVPAAQDAARFFDDYHRWMAQQGIDGVKVDSQAALEALAYGQGGRVVVAGAYRRALEASVVRNFQGRLINSMSATSECVYLARDSVVMRTSDDFWPMRPETHGYHLYTNAQAAMWFGEFMLPDWDMFQSRHSAGAYHAAARAIAGGPVYVSDKPDAHDFELLRKLVVSDGRVLRPDSIGRPSPDCLFADPTQERVLLKVFNTNRDCGVVGVFNAQYGPQASTPIPGEVSTADVPPLPAGEYGAYAQKADAVLHLPGRGGVKVSLAPGEWEIVSFAPVEHGFAALGLADKLNSTGAITRRQWSGDAECRLQLRDGGRFVGWASTEPVAAFCDGVAVKWRYGRDGRIELDLLVGGERELVLQWR